MSTISADLLKKFGLVQFNIGIGMELGIVQTIKLTVVFAVVLF